MGPKLLATLKSLKVYIYTYMCIYIYHSYKYIYHSYKKMPQIFEHRMKSKIDKRFYTELMTRVHENQLSSIINIEQSENTT